VKAYGGIVLVGIVLAAVLVASTAVVMSQLAGPFQVDMTFTCSPGSPYTVKECP
jgi:hypothetical protein